MSGFHGRLQRLEALAQPLLQPLLRWWGSIPVSVQGKLLVALPIAAVILSSGVALVGNIQRARTEAALQRHIAASHTVNDVLTLMVNAETGMRGYLLTRQDTYLEPYALAERDLSATLTDLREIATSEPGEGPRHRKLAAIDHLSSLADEQMADLAWQRAYVSGDDPAGAQIGEHLALGKRLMDAIRVEVASFQSEEERLLVERLEEINAVRARDYTAIFVTLIVALVTRIVAWYFFNRGVIRRVEHLTSHLRARRGGFDATWAPSGKHDEIGDLEQEVARLEDGEASPVNPLPPPLPPEDGPVTTVGAGLTQIGPARRAP